MSGRAFAAFVLPSVVAMLLLIALPLGGVAWLSVWNTYTKTTFVETQVRTPLGVRKETRTAPALDQDGNPILVREYYGTRHFENILRLDDLSKALTTDRSVTGTGQPATTFDKLSGLYRDISRIDFWGALEFTALYVAVTTPIMLALGLLIALGVNTCFKWLRGVLIFASLLPFIVTPVVGALSIKWLFLDNAIVSVLLQEAGFGKIYFLQSAFTIRALIITYGIWHVLPFAFVVFYAGLQTVPQETLEAALIDGATRWQRLRYVIIPHLMPLLVFVLLIHLMDAYRVFEPILVFSSGQGANSLQYLTYAILDVEQNFNKASAAALLTIAGVLLLLLPILLRTWREHRGAAA